MLDQLMWKDFQNQKGILLLGLFFLFGPYLIYFFSGAEGTDAIPILAFSANMSLIVSQLTMVVMGATIIGTERQNRGMDFLLALPASRSKILLSKTIICLIVAAIIWATFIIVTNWKLPPELGAEIRLFGTGAAVAGGTLFCVSWMFSVLFRGTAIPIAGALTVTTLILLAILKFWTFQDWSIWGNGKSFRMTLYSIYSAVGLLSFIAGWVVFTRRFEP